MGAETVRLTVLLDKATDIDLRTYLARQGMKKGDLSKFIEEAVRWRLLELVSADARQGFADLSDDEIIDLVDEAVAEVRRA